jgi:hypothetical protein
VVTLAAIAGLTIFVFVAWMSGGGGNQNTLLSVTTEPKKKAPPKPKPMANLVAKGVKGGAYVVVYRGTRTRKPIYEGTLENGKGHRFVGHHLWVYVFAPANLRLKLNGRTRVVPGAGTGSRRWLEVTPKRVQLATAPA